MMTTTNHGEEDKDENESHLFSRLSICTSCYNKEGIGSWESDKEVGVSLPCTPTLTGCHKSPSGRRRRPSFAREREKWKEDDQSESKGTQAIDIPAPNSIDFNTTAANGNSPISNWGISSPGDDPKEVKARLKVWAQAVALAASPH